MEAGGDVAVVLQLLLRHAVQEAAVDAAGQQVVGVLPKPGVNASQPVGQVAAVAGGVVGKGFQLRQLPEKPGRGESRSTGEAPFSCWTRKDTEMFGSMSSAVSDGVCQRAVVQNEQNGDKSLHGSGCAGPQGAEARGAQLKDEEICKFTPFWVTCSILPQFLCHCWPLPHPTAARCILWVTSCSGKALAAGVSHLGNPSSCPCKKRKVHTFALALPACPASALTSCG